MNQTKTTINYSVSRAEAQTPEFSKFNRVLIATLTAKFGGLRYNETAGTWTENGADFSETPEYSGIVYESGILIEVCSEKPNGFILDTVQKAFKRAIDCFPVSIEWVNIEQSLVTTHHFNINKV